VVVIELEGLYIPRVFRLTRQEQLVFCVVLGLLLVGWAVKAWRTSHPAAATGSDSISK
jgi:hypothetical protein